LRYDCGNYLGLSLIRYPIRIKNHNKMEQSPLSRGEEFKRTAVIVAGDYLNKLAGERIEIECRQRLAEGCTELVLDFARTEIVNSIGVSILLGVIDAASNTGAKVVFSEVNRHTAELFEMLGVSRHAVVTNVA
jgi:anti-anti-sigma regulatory factor